MGLLHLQPFRNSPCHFLIIVESAALNFCFSGCQIQFHQACHVHLYPCCAGQNISVIFIDVCQTVLNSAPFSDILHTHYTITLHLYQLPLNFFEGHKFNPQKPLNSERLCRTKFPVSLPLNIILSMNSIWMPLAVSATYDPYNECHLSYQKRKWCTQSCRLGRPTCYELKSYRLCKLTCWTRCVHVNGLEPTVNNKNLRLYHSVMVHCCKFIYHIIFHYTVNIDCVSLSERATTHPFI
jgi:hypothetical protein